MIPDVPATSILLPAYNAAETLPAALRSIQRQSDPRWECVVVDDGSGDGTADCARAFASADPRFRLVTGAHAGLVAALNGGLEHCRGRYVARMDADDLMHRDRLAAQRALLEARPDLAAVGCRVRLFPRAGLTEGRRAYEGWLNGLDSSRRLEEDAFIECPIAHPTLMIRREVLCALRYRDQGWPEDYDLVLRLLEAGHRLDVVPRRLLAWRDSPGRLSRTHDAYRLEQFTACKAAFLVRRFLAGDDRYILWGYGATGKALRRALLEHGRRPSHIVEVHPRRLGERIHGAPVIPASGLLEVPRRPIVVSVAGEAARRLIREALARLGFLELRDFLVAA